MIADLKPYAEYKESAQAWLGDVPRHWSVQPNRALFAEVKDRDHPDEEMLSVTITRGIVRQKTLLEGSSKKDSSNLDKSAYKLVRPRDIAYNKMRAWQGAIGASALRGIISPAYVVMRLRKADNFPSYFHHLYRTPQFAKEAERWSYGITSDMWSLRPEHFKMIYTSLPPPSEQAAIVRFLDWANGRLERAIRAKRKVIALLGEQKQAIIHRAVTRGLDPSVPLKPSGIPWLGEIPQHWEVRRLKSFVSNIADQTTVMSADEIYIALENVESWTGRVKPQRRYDEALFTGQVKRFEANDVLFGKLRPYLAKVITASSPGICVGEFFVLRAIDSLVSPFFLEQLLRTKTTIDVINSSTFGAKMPRADWQFVGNLCVALPSLCKQIVIVDSIHLATKPLDTAISRLEREIELLREYRTRLVADVVTGKLDVREAAARLPDEAPLETIEDDADLTDEADTADEEVAV